MKAKTKCPICHDSGFIEMGYLPSLDTMWHELCPRCFPDIKRKHPLHKTIKFGDGIHESKD